MDAVGSVQERYPVTKLLVYAETCDGLCLQSLLDAGVCGRVLKEEPVDGVVTAIQVIANGGTYFSPTLAELSLTVFQQLAQDEDFIHVLITRHRPQSNGIAERFVRTLKEWLKPKSWQSDEALAILLDLFWQAYNRPHQGLPIPGLSPNEFANRLWLF